MARIESASDFQFESYKIDSVRLEMKRVLGLLEFRGCIDPESVELKIELRESIYIKSTKRYIGSLELGLLILPPEKPKQKTDEESLLKVTLSIVGLFKVKQEGRLEKETEENLVKLQIPAILLPYARATLSSLLANAGFGSVVLPLINVHKIAKESSLTIREID